MRLLVSTFLVSCALGVPALGSVGCNSLAQNDTATAACASAGPGSGDTNHACVECCRKNGGTGRLSDSEKCICIGK
jgi:hypothetical protein